MGIKQRLRHWLLDAKSVEVERPEKIEKWATKIDPQERIAALKSDGADLTLEVERFGAGGKGYQG